MKKTIKKMAMVLAILLITGTAQAALVVMDDINGGDDIQARTDMFANALNESTSKWIAGTDFGLEAIGIYSAGNNPYMTGSELTMTLRSNDNGMPGGIISSFDFTINSPDGGWYGGYLDDSISVSSGEIYWIGIYSSLDRLTDPMGWIGSYFTADKNATYTPMFYNDGSIDNPDWKAPTRKQKPMFRFYGSPAAVPVPGAVWLLTSGFFGLLALQKRRRQ